MGGSQPVAGEDGELSPVAEAAWYVVAAITYVAAGIWQKALLNWLVGPIWLVAVVVLGPVAWRLVVRRGPP